MGNKKPDNEYVTNKVLDKLINCLGNGVKSFVITPKYIFSEYIGNVYEFKIFLHLKVLKI